MERFGINIVYFLCKDSFSLKERYEKTANRRDAKGGLMNEQINK